MTTTPPHILPTKPRRWYRRRGWQVLLLLLALFVGWFTWAIVELNETSSLYSRLEETPFCSFSFAHPDWVNATWNYSWFPKNLSEWLHHRFRTLTTVELRSTITFAFPDELLEAIGKRSWPGMYRLSCEGGKVHDGTRLLLPAQCPKLLQLVLIKAEINDAILDDMLPHYPNLVHLSLRDNPLEGRNLSVLSHCQLLNHLYLANTLISNETIKLLPILPQLQSLDLSGTNIDGSTLFVHGIPDTLLELRLSGTRVQLKHLTQLKGNESISHLTLNHAAISDEGMELLASLPTLWELDLDNTAISDQGVRALLATSKVTNLYLSHTRITSSSGPVFRKSETLGQLYLGHTAIDNECIAALNDHPKLWILSLEGTKVNDQSLPHLLSMPSLKKVTVNKDQFSPASIKQLSEHKVYVDVIEDRDKRK